MTVLLLIILAAILAVPVYAAEVSKTQYASEVYTENADYKISEIFKAPDILPPPGPIDGITIQTNPPVYFQRYALVSKPGSGIDISFVLTSPGVQYKSDLDGLKVSVNTVPVTTDTLTADKGVVRIQGIVPYAATPDQAVRIIELSGMSATDNNQFLVYVTTNEMAAAKNAIYLLNEKITKGGADSLKPVLQEAVDNYKKGNFILAKTFAEKGSQQGSSQTEGFNDGLLRGLIIAVILLVVGSVAGFLYGRKIANKPDLLKIEQVVLKYYGTRSENPFSPVKISRECDAVLERAFDFNAKRAELLKKQKDQPGGSVDPNRLTSPELRPSLFQALYEKTKFGKCQAFDAGIVYLNKKLSEKESKR
ncbi:MAG: hypothetical protein WCO93_11100 [bacterium]